MVDSTDTTATKEFWLESLMVFSIKGHSRQDWTLDLNHDFVRLVGRQLGKVVTPELFKTSGVWIANLDGDLPATELLSGDSQSRFPHS